MNRFKVEAAPAKCWWVSIYDRQTEEYLPGFIAHSMSDAKNISNEKIEFYLENLSDSQEKEIEESEELKKLRQKKKEYEEKLKTLFGFEKDILESTIKETEKEIKELENDGTEED